jgi:hypothetical protein
MRLVSRKPFCVCSSKLRVAERGQVRRGFSLEPEIWRSFYRSRCPRTARFVPKEEADFLAICCGVRAKDFKTRLARRLYHSCARERPRQWAKLPLSQRNSPALLAGHRSLTRGELRKKSTWADPLGGGRLVNFLRCSLSAYRFRILEKQNWLQMSQIFSPLLALISRWFCFSRILQSEATSPYWRRPQTDHATHGSPRSEAWPR